MLVKPASVQGIPDRFGAQSSARRLTVSHLGPVSAIALLAAITTLNALEITPALASTGPNYALVAVSCDAYPHSVTSAATHVTTTKFCAAVDSAGDAFRFSQVNGTPNWTKDASIAGALYSVSCFDSTWCEATGDQSSGTGYIYKYTSASGAWSNLQVDSGHKLNDVSCPTEGSSSTGFCMAVDNNGNLLTTTTTGVNWSTPSGYHGDGSNNIQAVSCWGTNLCMAVDAAGNYIEEYPAGTFTVATASGTNLISLSCTAQSFCLAGDTNAHTWKWNGSSWNDKGSDGAGQLNSISCWSSSGCQAVDGLGHTLSWSSGGWSAAYNTDLGNTFGAPGGISCANLNGGSGPQFCAAVDGVGNAIMYSSKNWLTTNMDNTAAVVTVSCVNLNYCEITDGSYAFTYDTRTIGQVSGDLWNLQKTSQVTTNGFYSLSCVTATFCQAGDGKGYVYTWSGSSWSSGTPVSTSASPVLFSMSCSMTNFCIAGDGSGYVWTYSGSPPSWSSTGYQLSTAPTNPWILGISCPSGQTSFCAATDFPGNVYTYNSGTWSSATSLSTFGTSISCPNTSFCQATTGTGYAYLCNIVSNACPSGGWSGTDIDGSNQVQSISCYSSTNCVAVDAFAGYVMTYSGSPASWAPASLVDANGFNMVSCPTSSFCLSVANSGDMLSSLGGTATDMWSAPQLIHL